MKSPNSYFEYFTQGKNHFFDYSWVDKVDLSWVDELNKERAANKEHRIQRDIERGYNPEDTHSSDEDVAVKNFEDIDFPPWHEWPENFLEKYRETNSLATQALAEMIKSAEQKIVIDNMQIYFNCKDGKSYFSTFYYGNGSIEVASLTEDSSFDSLETAIFAFFNDYTHWYENYGKEHDAALRLSNLRSIG